MKIVDLKYLGTEEEGIESGDGKYRHQFFVVLKPAILAACQCEISVKSEKQSLPQETFAAALMGMPRSALKAAVKSVRTQFVHREMGIAVSAKQQFSSMMDSIVETPIGEFHFSSIDPYDPRLRR